MSDTAKFLTRLAVVAEIRAGFPFRGALDELADGDVMIVQVRDVSTTAQFDWADLPRKALPKSRAADFLRAGDILITTRGRRNDAIALIEPPGDAVAATNLFVIRLNADAGLLPEFLAWQINQKPAQDILMASATGSHILNLTRPALEELPIVIPPVQQQRLAIEMAECAAAERGVFNRLIDNRQQQMNALASDILARKHSA